jgi:hypothetical protein
MSNKQTTDKQISNAFIDDTRIKTNIQLVASTYKNISFNSLTKLLHRLSERINYKYFRYYKKYPEKKIGMHCYNERVLNNAHTNILLQMPPEYNVINVVLDMEKIWKKLDTRKYPKFKLYQDFDVRDQIKCTNYARKEKYYVPI